MRVLFAGLLLACAVLVAPPSPAAASPMDCPPACDQIPDSAWPDPWLLPMDSDYHWPPFASLAVAVPAARFMFEELCGSPVPLDDPRRYAVAAQAATGQQAGQWSVRAQVVHWRGETWRGGQLAIAVYDAAVSALRRCQSTAPWVSPSITTAEPNRIAAVISGPVVAHQYLLVDPRSSTISELVFSRVAGPDTPLPPWPMVPDTQVFDAMSAPLCRAYLGSCG